MTGSLPDHNLSTDLFEIIGRLRQSAASASRSGQFQELERIADEILQWQIRLRKAITLALGERDMSSGWGAVVNQIATVRKERDGAQQLHTLDIEDLARYAKELRDALEAKQ